MRDMGVDILLKVSEYEEAANFTDFDLSLNPRFINYITDGPVFAPFMNAYSKIQMFEELSKTPYFDYIYSCLRNTDKRWCGECGKCRRIAEYGRRLGIDTSRIDLDPTIPYATETSPISRHYADLMDIVAPRSISCKPEPQVGDTNPEAFEETSAQATSKTGRPAPYVFKRLFNRFRAH